MEKYITIRDNTFLLEDVLRVNIRDNENGSFNLVITLKNPNSNNTTIDLFYRSKQEVEKERDELIAKLNAKK